MGTALFTASFQFASHKAGSKNFQSSYFRNSISLSCCQDKHIPARANMCAVSPANRCVFVEVRRKAGLDAIERFRDQGDSTRFQEPPHIVNGSVWIGQMLQHFERYHGVKMHTWNLLVLSEDFAWDRIF